MRAGEISQCALFTAVSASHPVCAGRLRPSRRTRAKPMHRRGASARASANAEKAAILAAVEHARQRRKAKSKTNAGKWSRRNICPPISARRRAHGRLRDDRRPEHRRLLRRRPAGAADAPNTARWRNVYMNRGGPWCILSTQHHNANDLADGGPGFSFPVWEWNGDEYVNANRQVAGLRSRRRDATCRTSHRRAPASRRRSELRAGGAQQVALDLERGERGGRKMAAELARQLRAIMRLVHQHATQVRRCPDCGRRSRRFSASLALNASQMPSGAAW